MKKTQGFFQEPLFRRATPSWWLALLLVTVSATAAGAAPFVYMTNTGSNTVSVIDTAGNNVVATAPVDAQPRGATITADGAFAYVTNFDLSPSSVSVVDTANPSGDTAQQIFLSPRAVVPPPTYYGPGYRANGMANFPLGGVQAHVSGYGTTGKTAFSIRFRATRTGTLSQIGVRIETANTANRIDQSYGWGTGGTIQIRLRTDDGRASHLPSGTVLGSFTTPADGAYAFFNNGVKFNAAVSGGSDNINTLMTLSPSVTLIAGQLYHIVLSQIAADGADNFVSVSGLYVPGAGERLSGSPLSPLQPTYSDTDYAGLVSVDNGPWQTTTQFWTNYGLTPNIELHYSDGYIDGRFAYSYLFVDNTNTISGKSAFRELFTPSVNVTATTVGIYAYRVSGNNPLTVNVKDVNGKALAFASFPASSFPAVNRRYLRSAALSSAITLAKGQTYSIEFDCRATSTYNLDAMSDGSPASVNDIGAHPADYFRDGHAQQNVAGAGWTDYTDTSTAPDGTANAHFMWYLKR